MAHVNLLKQVKIDDRWVLRSIPKKANGQPDWGALPVGNYFIESREKRKRRRLPGRHSGMPSTRIHVADDEVLLDDSLRYVEHAIAAGVDARADVWMGMPHGFPGGIGLTTISPGPSSVSNQVTVFVK
jgi:acetyl esterase/lipase